MLSVNEFRWLTINDPCLMEFKNWSRTYEYAYVLNKIKQSNIKNPSIHNTCCGTGNLHAAFAKRLEDLSSNVLNSDMIQSDFFRSGYNFKLYNMYNPSNESYDIVINVSSLEDASQKERELAFTNLINQVKPGGRLILTCDHHESNGCHSGGDCNDHRVPIPLLERLLGQPIQPIDPRFKLNSARSVYAEAEFSNYNIIAIDVTKT